MIETFVAYKPFPCEKKMVSNYIPDYLVENVETKIIEKYELDEHFSLLPKQAANLLVKSR